MDPKSHEIDNYIFLMIIKSFLTPYMLRSTVSINVKCNYFSGMFLKIIQKVLSFKEGIEVRL